MATAPLPTTRISLLARLRDHPTDQAGWEAFVERYGRHIYRWCRHWHLQDADAQDVTQDILVKLYRKFATFAYDPAQSFRGWLKTIAHHTWRDFEASRRCRLAAALDSGAGEPIFPVQARLDFAERLETAFDLELLEMASVRVRLRVAAHTWEAFRLTALEGLAVADVAARLQMQVATVYVTRSRVQKMLQEELANLEGDSERSF